jgi:hydrogenase-1 operon protein HyaF
MIFPKSNIAGLNEWNQTEIARDDFLFQFNTYIPERLRQEKKTTEHCAEIIKNVLRLIQNRLEQEIASQSSLNIELISYSAHDLQLIDRILGEGGTNVAINATSHITMQESIFPGIWKIVEYRDGKAISNRIEIGVIPSSLRTGSIFKSLSSITELPERLPCGVLLAPTVLFEIRGKLRIWWSDKSDYVINLSALSLSKEDISFLHGQLGAGDTVILSRDRGNCKICSTAFPNCWQVFYLNNDNVVILHTIEITEMPSAVVATANDLTNSLIRIKALLQTMNL